MGGVHILSHNLTFCCASSDAEYVQYAEHAQLTYWFALFFTLHALLILCSEVIPAPCSGHTETTL